MLVPDPRRQDTDRAYVSRPYPLGVHPSAERDGSANVAVYAPGVADLDLVFRRPGEHWQRRDVPLIEAVRSYVDDILRHRPDEQAYLGGDTGEIPRVSGY